MLFLSQIQDLKLHELRQSNKFRRIGTIKNVVSKLLYLDVNYPRISC